MPLYPYACADCDHSFEVLVARSADTPEVVCPNCEGRTVRRGFGLPARPKLGVAAATNCRGDGPPCALPQCGRRS